MKEILRYLWLKLRAEKGEVSVEWVMVAVIMAIIILGAFLPGVGGAINAAVTAISGAITTATGS
jgi:Flp pilus assembly pilin Flp